MLENFISEEGAWSIVTEYIAKHYCRRDKRLTMVPLQDDALLERVTYMIYYRYSKPWIQSLIDEFMNEAVTMLRKAKSIELLTFPHIQ